MSALDITLVATVVAAAAIYLAYALLGRGSSSKACHAPSPTASTAGSSTSASDVVVGAALARGLDAAARKRRQQPHQQL